MGNSLVIDPTCFKCNSKRVYSVSYSPDSAPASDPSLSTIPMATIPMSTNHSQLHSLDHYFSIGPLLASILISKIISKKPHPSYQQQAGASSKLSTSPIATSNRYPVFNSSRGSCRQSIEGIPLPQETLLKHTSIQVSNEQYLFTLAWLCQQYLNSYPLTLAHLTQQVGKLSSQNSTQLVISLLT